MIGLDRKLNSLPLSSPEIEHVHYFINSVYVNFTVIISVLTRHECVMLLNVLSLYFQQLLRPRLTSQTSCQSHSSVFDLRRRVESAIA